MNRQCYYFTEGRDLESTIAEIQKRHKAKRAYYHSPEFEMAAYDGNAPYEMAAMYRTEKLVGEIRSGKWSPAESEFQLHRAILNNEIPDASDLINHDRLDPLTT